MIDKNKKLEVFKEMLRCWEIFAKSSYRFELRYCAYGFCHYLNAKYPFNAKDYLNELKHDMIKEEKKGYWYEVYFGLTGFGGTIYFQEVIINQLQPRIDHLKRTIARLEKELKP